MGITVPFFRPWVGEEEIAEVVEVLKGGWLTTGPRTHRFEAEFAAAVGAKHAIAVNSCTAALHLALEAIGLQRGDLALVPSLTFAATAEVVRYFDAIPVLVECDPDTFLMDMADAEDKLERLSKHLPVAGVPEVYEGSVKAILPMHYGGQMADVLGARRLADKYGLRVIEDAAHTLPASWREGEGSPWESVGSSADITCFSFYANKTITTGEGGMAVTNSPEWADRMKIMSLHGISRDAWKRFSLAGSWYYEIIAPGFKYNLTDIAAAVGLHQLKRAEAFHARRAQIAARYHEGLAGLPLRCPVTLPDRVHSWHLYVIRLDLGALAVDRARFIEELKARQIGTSVHYTPLHLHPYYRERYGYKPEDLPKTSALYPELVSLPIFPAMSDEEVDAVIAAVREVCALGL